LKDLLGKNEEDVRDGVIGSILVTAVLADMTPGDVWSMLESVNCPPISYTRVEELKKRLTSALVAMEQDVITYNEFIDVVRDEVSWWHTNGGA
jgi:hypothetical protein